MLKITNSTGKVVAILKDDATEPEVVIFPEIKEVVSEEVESEEENKENE